MTLEYAKDIATIVGVLVAVGALMFTAFSATLAWLNTKVNLRRESARFWLDLRSEFAKYEDVHRQLQPRGPWSDRKGPETPDEWAEVEAYMDLFEHCEIMIDGNLIDESTFREIYAYRLRNIAANEPIRREKLVCQDAKWRRFLALLKRMDVQIDQ